MYPVRTDRFEELAPCLELVVPVLAQSWVDFLNEPGPTGDALIEINVGYDTFWQVSEGINDEAMRLFFEDGLQRRAPMAAGCVWPRPKENASMPTRFDLIAVDAVEPRETAAPFIERSDFRIELDEDDGRWLVLASPTQLQRLGLQRSDHREVAARKGSLDDVLGGGLTLEVADPTTTAEFFRAAFGLAGQVTAWNSMAGPC